MQMMCEMKLVGHGWTTLPAVLSKLLQVAVDTGKTEHGKEDEKGGLFCYCAEICSLVVVNTG